MSQFPRLSRTRWTVGLIFAGLFAFLGFGMWGGFPVFDDAYLVLFLRESTLETLAAHHSHRPLFGQLLKWSAAAFGLDRGPYVAMALALWAILAWQTARLARRVRPDDALLPSLAALLVLTPVLVTTQFTTATTVLSVNLPVSLVLAALLTCLAADAPVGRTRGLGAALLVAGAVAISEYGIAAGFAAAAFLAARRRVRDAGWVAAGTVAGYAVFRAFSHLEVRAKQVPSVQIRNFLGEPHLAALRFVDGLWHSLAGGWAWAAGAIYIEPDSRSTILGVLAAGVVGAVFAAIDRRPAGFGGDRVPLTAFAVSVAAGILPVALANRNVRSFDPYESRYLLPILPFSALALAGSVRSLTPLRLRRAATSIVAGLAVYWVIVAAFQTRNFQSRLQELGDRLRPLLRDPGIVVAVVPDRTLDGSDLTPKVTWTWSDADARRVWVMPDDSAEALFGSRVDCRGAERIDLPPALMQTERNGPVSHLVWVSPKGKGVDALEPYCVGPVR